MILGCIEFPVICIPPYSLIGSVLYLHVFYIYIYLFLAGPTVRILLGCFPPHFSPAFCLQGQMGFLHTLG